MPVLQPLAGSPAAPQQHKQPSRKGKKAWRKNVDVSEVEHGLEERNKQIIKGGVVKEKESQDLFLVAEEGDAEIARTLPKRFKKGLKADEILAQRSAVPAVSMRKKRTTTTTDGVLPVKRQRTKYVPQREVARLRRVADGHHDATVDIVDASYDPWAVAAPPPAAVGESTAASFLPAKPKAVKAPKTLKQAPISLAANGKPVPAVATPKGAFSYNPSFPEYAARLTDEGRKAVEAETKRLAALEAERMRMEAVARSMAEAEEAEARADLSEWDDDSAWEGFESGVEDDETPSNAKRPKRKTPAQRNRIKRRKEAEAKKRHDAINVRKQEQERRLEELLAQEKASRERIQQLTAANGAVAVTGAPAKGGGDGDGDGNQDDEDDAVGDDNVLRRRQLGKFKLPEKDLELVLPDELQDSLRLLKPEGNLLKDRYRNVLVRGIVEARRKRPFRKQARTKSTEKWAHKDFHLF